LDRVVVGVVNFGLLAAFVFAIWSRSVARKESGRLAPAVAGSGPVAGAARQAPLPETRPAEARPAWGGAGHPPGAMSPGAMGWPSGTGTVSNGAPPGAWSPPGRPAGPAGGPRWAGPPGSPAGGENWPGEAPGPRTPWPPSGGGAPRPGG
jgi:hypothetical protein